MLYFRPMSEFSGLSSSSISRSTEQLPPVPYSGWTMGMREPASAMDTSGHDRDSVSRSLQVVAPELIDKTSPLNQVRGDYCTKALKVHGVPALAFRELPSLYQYELNSYLWHPLQQYYHVVRVAGVPKERKEPVHDTLSFYFGFAEENRRVDLIDKLLRIGYSLAVEEGERTELDNIQGAQQIMNGLNELAAGLCNIDKARARLKFTDDLTVPQRVNAKLGLQGIDKMNQNGKDPVVADFMRRWIPRFAWDPHHVPENVVVPNGYGDRLQSLWSGYTARDASFLIHPDHLAEGMAPFHMGMNAADQVGKDGHTDLAYQLKTNLITTTLRRERERATYDPLVWEIPYFEPMFAGILTGRAGSGPKNAYFDFPNAIIKTAQQTWKRLELELRASYDGPATQFMCFLSEHFGTALVPYLAASMGNYARQSTFDLAGMLRHLQNSNLVVAPMLPGAILALPNGPLLNNEALRVFATHLASASPEIPRMTVVNMAKQLVANADMYSFKTPVQAADTKEAVVVTVEISAATRVVEATLRYKNGHTQKVSVTLDLETGAVGTTSIDEEALGADVEAQYRQTVERAIVAESERVAAEKAARIQAATSIGMTAVASADRQPVQQRKVDKVKTTGTADLSMADPEIEQTIEPPSGNTTRKISITGMTIETVEECLKDQRVFELPADAIMQRVDMLVRAAIGSSKTFGKRLDLTAFRGSEGVKLRQVNWIVDGRQIRLYFDEGPNGALNFCGVYEKQGYAHQTRYLKGLIKRLVRAR